MKNYFCKQFYLHLVTLPIFEIRTFFGRVSTFFYRLLGKLVNGCLDILDLDVSVERHVAHHYADIFGSYQTIVVKIIHIKGKPHFLVQITHEDGCEIVDELLLGNRVLAF